MRHVFNYYFFLNFFLPLWRTTIQKSSWHTTKKSFIFLLLRLRFFSNYLCRFLFFFKQLFVLLICIKIIIICFWGYSTACWWFYRRFWFFWCQSNFFNMIFTFVRVGPYSIFFRFGFLVLTLDNSCTHVLQFWRHVITVTHIGTLVKMFQLQKM